MFGKLIKNLLGNAQEAVESISNTEKETDQTNETIPHSKQPEINYKSSDFADVIDYTE